MIRRLLVPVAAALGVLVLVAGPASAHVVVDPSSATQGSYTVLTFRVPNEMSDADTVGLRVKLPADHPIASVSVQPKDGWKIVTKTGKPSTPLSDDDGTVDEVVTEVDWSGGTITPGQFDTFSISVGPLPDDTAQLVFPTIQEYQAADGTASEVSWIQTPTSGGAEPEHPAPTLQLVAADGSSDTTQDTSGGSQHGTATTAPTVTAAPTSTSSDSSSDSSALLAIILAAIALVVAIVAIGMHLTKKRGPEVANFTPSGDGTPDAPANDE